MANFFEFKNEIDFFGNGYSTRYFYDIPPKSKPIGIEIQKKGLIQPINKNYTLARRILFEEIEASRYSGSTLASMIIAIMEADWADAYRNFQSTISKEGA